MQGRWEPIWRRSMHAICSGAISIPFHTISICRSILDMRIANVASGCSIQPKENLNRHAAPQIFALLLKDCAKKGSLSHGKRIHAHMNTAGLHQDRFLGNILIDMYRNCHTVEAACSVFNRMDQANVISWTSIIATYVQHDYGAEALNLLKQMQYENVQPNRVTFIIILGACVYPQMLSVGKSVHGSSITWGLESNVYVSNALINMYGKCGCLEDAWKVFKRMPERVVVSWNTLISACVEYRQSRQALKLFSQMDLEGIGPNVITFLAVINACCTEKFLAEGMRVHSFILVRNLQLDVMVGTALINLYSRCSDLKNVQRLFHVMPVITVASWNSLIAACIQNGHAQKSHQLLRQMCSEGFIPNKITFITILEEYNCSMDLAEGKVIHSQILKHELECDTIVGCSLVNMYGNCGTLEDAFLVFTALDEHEVFLLTALISACVKHERGKEALELFHQMNLAAIKPDMITFLAVVDACATVASFTEGRKIHMKIVDHGFDSVVAICNALVDMYSKCGFLEVAHWIFANMLNRDVITWTTMIAAYAQHGWGKEALYCFQKMHQNNVAPNRLTYINILSAFSNAGLFDEACCYIASINESYSIIPMDQHFGCMTALFGRMGQLDEATDFVGMMPLPPTHTAWMTLLGICGVYGNVEWGKHAAENAIELDPLSDAPYVLLSNIYAGHGKWREISMLKKTMEEKRIIVLNSDAVT